MSILTDELRDSWNKTGNQSEKQPPRRRSPTTVIKQKPKGKTKAAGRFRVLNNFVDFTMRDLKAADVRVWFVLYRDTKDGTAATAQADIARRAGISVRAVHNSIKQLERRGLLKVVYKGGLNRGSSRYRLSPLQKEWNRGS